jgi:hypothetical protein
MTKLTKQEKAFQAHLKRKTAARKANEKEAKKQLDRPAKVRKTKHVPDYNRKPKFVQVQYELPEEPLELSEVGDEGTDGATAESVDESPKVDATGLEAPTQYGDIDK